MKTRESENDAMEDDETIVAGMSCQADINFSRCTIKTSFKAKESAYEDCINRLKEICNAFQSAGDKKSFIAS